MLCEALINTGMAGRPDEYFWADAEHIWFERLGVNSFDEFLDRVIQKGMTANGVFGAKFFAGEYLHDFISKVKQLSAYSNQQWRDCELLSKVFPNLHYIWMTRRNKVRQAVSYHKALQTDAWTWKTRQPQNYLKEPEFDFGEINYFIQEVTMREARWQEFFDECGIRPLTIVYEDFACAYEETLYQTLRYLNLVVPADVLSSPRKTRKQADAVSEEWVQRFRREKQAQWRNLGW